MSTITIVGNLAEDPTLRYTKGGAAVSNLRVLENTGRYDRAKSTWVEDDEPTGYNVTAWGALAENAAESLHAGDAVIVAGTIATEAYEVDGAKRTRQVITAENLGASLRFATATVTKNPRRAGSSTEQPPATGLANEAPRPVAG
jgi:single-strand DNA-binding protein